MGFFSFSRGPKEPKTMDELIAHLKKTQQRQFNADIEKKVRNLHTDLSDVIYRLKSQGGSTAIFALSAFVGNNVPNDIKDPDPEYPLMNMYKNQKKIGIYKNFEPLKKLKTEMTAFVRNKNGNKQTQMNNFEKVPLTFAKDYAQHLMNSGNK
jgi:hypothetical protein